MLPEQVVYDFISDLVANAPSNSALYGCEVRESVWTTIKKDKSLAIGTALKATAAANPGGALLERNVLLGVWIEVAVGKSDSRLAKLAETQAIGLELVQAVRENATLGQTTGVCSAETLDLRRGYDNVSGGTRAVQILPVLINRRGEMPSLERLLNALQII